MVNYLKSNSQSNMMTFINQEFGEVRTITERGKTLFCGSDVAKALGYKNPTKALNDHCKGIVERRTNDSLGRQQNMKFISEGDIYRLAAKSVLPGADKFESWIFDEVLPTIRKTGGYIPVSEDMSDKEIMARALMIAQKTIEHKDEIIFKQAEKIETDAPKVAYAETAGSCKGTISVGDYSKVLYDKYKIDMGRNQLFKWLREQKILDSNNLPYQKYMNAGWFKVIEIPRPDIGRQIPVTRITSKGQQKLHSFIEKNYLKEAVPA